MKKVVLIMALFAVAAILFSSCGAHKGCEAYSQNHELVQESEEA
ncbi:MAG: hypothetical protein ACPF8V_01455 [Luteibaculum sp.]